MKVEENFAELLIRDEGPAILMWAIEGAMLDYADADNTMFNSLKRPMVEATYAYTRENSLYWGWVEEHCARDRSASMDFVDAFNSFKEYVWKTTRERSRDRRSDFKAALKAMLPEIEYLNRTSGAHPNRLYIAGLGFTNLNEEAAKDVVDVNSGRGENVIDINGKRAEKAAAGVEQAKP
jgi:hypothetical protein